MNFILSESTERIRKRLHRDSEKVKFMPRVSCICVTLSFIAVGMFASHLSAAQSPEKRMTKIGMEKGNLTVLFEKLREQTGLSFVFPRNVDDYKNINLPVADRTVKEVLDIVLKGTDLSYRFKGNKVFIFVEKKEKAQSKVEEKDRQPPNSYSPNTVTGKVFDSEGVPLVGVNIIVKGTTKGTSADAAGEYQIDVNEHDVLSYSSIGFKTEEIVVGQQTKIDVTLENDVTSLKEVTINAGYYDVTDKEKTGSISKVTSKVIESQPVTNPLGALQGRMPGVQIQQTGGVPGSDFKIEIRGRNSLRPNGNQPLYIVDGVPFSTEKVSSGYSSSGVFGGNNLIENSGTSPITSINQADIESIEVLKDADATAIYGSRGANGVVLITTKKAKAGKTTFGVNAYSGLGVVPRVKMLDTRQYVVMRKEAFTNDGIIVSPSTAPDLTVWDTTRYTDWQKELIGTAQSTSIQSSVSSGTDQTHFLFSLGYRKESSVLPGDFAYKKGSFHLSVNHRSNNEKFFIDISFSGAKDKNNQILADITGRIRLLPPNAPNLYDENGRLNWENSTWENPLAALNEQYNGDVTSLVGNTMIGFEVVKNLQFKTSLGVNYLQSDEITTRPSTIYNPAEGKTSADSYVVASNGATQSWIIEPQLNYERKIGDGKFLVLIGTTFQERLFGRKSNGYRGFPSNALLHNLAAASSSFSNELIKSLYRYASVFGRLNYNWDGKYILNLTARRDGSSRFGIDKQFANFGAIGVAWVFSNESVIRDRLPFLSFGKLRASYGITGSDQIGDYQYLDTYSTPASSFANTYQGVTVLNPTKLFNPNYAWESNRKIEAAIESGFFNDRVVFVLGFYRNRSSNQLVEYTLPYTTGFSGVLANLPATVQNTGWEIELTTINVEKIISWTTSFNLSVPKNKLIEFPDIKSSTYGNIYTVGQSIYMQRKFEYLGVDSETGYYSFRDVNGDGALSFPDDNKKPVFVGQYFFGGIGNTIRYKGISLDMLFQFVKQTGVLQERFVGNSYNYYSYILEKNVWRRPGDHADFQRFATNSNSMAAQANNDFKSSDASIGDASFIRLKNVSLAYQVPEKWTPRVQCQVYFQGQNLLTFTNYEGGDPETQYGQTLPPLRMFTMGLKFSFR